MKELKPDLTYTFTSWGEDYPFEFPSASDLALLVTEVERITAGLAEVNVSLRMHPALEANIYR